MILFKDLGLIDYKEAWDFQEDLFNKAVKQKLQNRKDENDAIEIKNHLFFCEHPHVYTMGKSGDAENMLFTDSMLERINAVYYKINRGGDITYHGPGQIVGYPILDIDSFDLSLKTYIEKIEEAIILTLKKFNIESTRLDGATGVWLDVGKPNVRKICAIGVKASRGITMHGFAFNVNTNLDYFGYINPCGFVDKGVTSLEKELGKKQDIEEVKDILKQYIAEVFNAKLV